MRVPTFLNQYREGTEITNLLTYYDSVEIDENKFKTLTVSPAKAYAFEGDFYGLLKDLFVEEKMFLPSLYLNNLTNPFSYDGKQLEIKIALPTRFKGR